MSAKEVGDAQGGKLSNPFSSGGGNGGGEGFIAFSASTPQGPNSGKIHSGSE